MLTATEFSDAIGSATDQLRVVEQELGTVTCPKVTTLTTNLRRLTRKSIGKLLAQVPTGHRNADKAADYVYVIRLPVDERPIVNWLWKHLTRARTRAKDYCRINRENADTDTLYVGRSKKLRTRLTQHLGTAQRRTYSMHLQRWAKKVDVDIHISYIRFEKREDLLVQAIEDGLWASLRPAFGRKGGR